MAKRHATATQKPTTNTTSTTSRNLEYLEEMRTKGLEHQLPGTERMVRIRTVDAQELLKDDKLPDMLTPMVIRSVYSEVGDREVNGFISQPKDNKEDALKMLDTINYIVSKSLVDGADIKDLTLAEKRWIFRLAMGPAELLINFRYQEESDVEPVAEGEDVQQTAE